LGDKRLGILYSGWELQMKIAMIVHAYYLKDARVRRYAELLVREGHQVDVLCLREDREQAFEEHQGVNIYRINLSRNRGGILSYFFEYLSAFVRFFAKLNILFLKGHRYYLIHVHNFPNFLIFVPVVQKLFGTKIILDVHDPMPELFRSKYKIGENHPLIRLLYLEERISTRFADFVIAANHVFKDLLSGRSCPAEKISVVLNAPDDNFCKCKDNPVKSSVGPKSFNVLYIGTLAERYGLETVLNAIAKIKQSGSIPGIQLTIIPKIKNEGDYVQKIVHEVNTLKLNDCFTLLDPVPHDKMPDIIREADLSVYTPLPDVHMDIALSLKIPEIVAVGRPLVVSKLSVLKRYFGVDSFFMCEPGDVDDCAAKITQVYQQPEEAQSRVRRAQEALKKFAWDKQTAIYHEIIDNLSGMKQKSQITTLKYPSKRMVIKKITKKLVSIITYSVGLSALWYWAYAKRATRILAYHGIEPCPSNSYSVSVENFDKQMRYLKENCNVISLLHFEKLLQGSGNIPSDTIVITFDDGFMNFYQYAYPILKKYHLLATCFIIASKIESSDDNFMHRDILQEIIKDGIVSIGSHTASHKSLSQLGDKELLYEISGSKNKIEMKLGTPVDYFSYPYGTPRDIDKRCIEILARSGYKLACTSINGVNSNNSDPYALRRTKIEWGDSLASFKKILRGSVDIWAIVDYCFGFLQNKKEVDSIR
jgi:peptidoglycan/xylan/chitin deacetylase (PgdA/CDA1 family)/glycosyltransferase involved in cell wall biosynthesis